jgi:predicted membrane GTPase involved in stress response
LNYPQPHEIGKQGKITAGLTAPVEMSLDTCFEYLATEEVLEVTPSKKRMGKNTDLQVKRKARNKSCL